MRITATITEAPFPESDNRYVGFVVTHKDDKKENVLYVKAYASIMEKKLKVGDRVKLSIILSSKQFEPYGRWVTSAFAVGINKIHKFNPNAGFMEKAFDRAMDRNADK